MNDTQPAGPEDTVEVTLGERTVRVPAGGLFDRYRMQTDLDEVAKDPRVAGVEFFRSQPKVEVQSRIGPTFTPNFYYAMSNARLTMIAPTRAIRGRLPRELDPLQIAPGFGLVSLMLFRYDVADIDFYTEAAVGIAVKPARHGRLGAVDLLAALKNDHLDSYVLALPVNTDIAQVRGHDGYGFPKWVTEIDVAIDGRTTFGRIANDAGGTDLELKATTPRQTMHHSGTAVSSLNSYTQFGGGWHTTFSQTNALSAGTQMFPRDLELTLGEGRLSDDIRSLRPVRNLRLDVMVSGQLALHMPTVISIS
ncbi:acetoacetate decarboxylase (plasmid) [Streptomyces sp. WAC00288]|uniref:acetoacetate decarboxylase family protein n=1 Tax=unclassified Streptomyces TaxID=2593676 RepID=UPI0007871842|nr:MULTISPECIES: acetoacetate decarboxylase family protein [unclassified Streptomyces]AVI00227.1 acetoacetate decarboxylase [Streptomyces sp. WAC00288]KYG51057.1 acetoacetate decarboxylase [Streptomyces sp. WAC04657]